jgi:predicted transglutaminase-like cysteine proteinase
VRGDRASVLALSPEAWKDLVRVNKWVNQAIKPLTDLEHWGVLERWSYPDDGYGDCEDYVLLKRHILIQSGWPREALLVTVVRDKDGDGHAVLTVSTDKGDYVLDNQTEKILLWSETGYGFVKRQSQSHPNVWVSLDDLRPAVATATSR